MLSRSRLIFIVFYVTAVLIATVHLRTASSRIFYRYRMAKVSRKDVSEHLRRMQLELERLASPKSVSEHIQFESNP
jgi:hypothetical protein